MPNSFRIAANIGFLWRDRPFFDRIALAGRAGFDAVEFHDDAQRHAIDAVGSALQSARLPLLGLNTDMSGTVGRAALPEARQHARADIDRAIERARMLGGRAIHVVAGKAVVNVDTRATYVENLRYAARAAERHGLTVLIEPLSAAAMPGYFLSGFQQAADMIERTGMPNVRIMFDVYHVHQNGEPIAETFARFRGLIGHIQLADPVTRAEPPTTGPHAVDRMIGELQERGYSGDFGAEYIPAASVEAGLGWLRAARI